MKFHVALHRTQSGNVSDVSFQTGDGTKRVTITTVPQARARRVAVSQAHTATQWMCGWAEAEGTRRAAQRALHISLLRSRIARCGSRSLVPTHLSSSWSLYPFAHRAPTSPFRFPAAPSRCRQDGVPYYPPPPYHLPGVGIYGDICGPHVVPSGKLHMEGRRAQRHSREGSPVAVRLGPGALPGDAYPLSLRTQPAVAVVVSGPRPGSAVALPGDFRPLAVAVCSRSTPGGPQLLAFRHGRVAVALPPRVRGSF